MLFERMRVEYSGAEGKAISKLATRLPYLPLTLTLDGQSVAARGLLDSGATVNVLPYQVGVELGAIWEEQKTQITLTGNLRREAARALVLWGKVGEYPPVRLAFAWTRSGETPLILGQVNFFMEFEVCFYRSQLRFEIAPNG